MRKQSSGFVSPILIVGVLVVAALSLAYVITLSSSVGTSSSGETAQVGGSFSEVGGGSQVAQASNALQTVVVANSKASQTSTFSFTVPSGTNRLLLVYVAVSKHPPTAPAVTSVTYAGQNLTKLSSDLNAGRYAGEGRSDVWYMVNPPEGTANVNISSDQASSVLALVETLTGVNQSMPIRGHASNNGFSTVASVTVLSVSGDVVADFVCDGTSVNSSNQTTVASLNVNNLFACNNIGASTKAGAPSVTMNWSIGNDVWIDTALSIEPATIVATPPSDTTPPSISSVSASGITVSGATINWVTDQPSDSQVEYGTTNAYGNSSTLNSSLVTSHSVTLSGLNSNTLYHFRADSRNSQGTQAKSGDLTFTTSQTGNPPVNPPVNPPQQPPVVVTGQTLLSSVPPVLTAVSDGTGMNYELGTTFKSTAAGQILAIRFYKSARESGSHTGHIWSSSGSLLATVAFTNETASGWQQQTLPAPLYISPNTEYTVSVNTGNTYYAVSDTGFASPVTAGTLSSSGPGHFGPVGSYPTRTFKTSNYFRDIVFEQTGAVIPPITPPTTDNIPTVPTGLIATPVSSSEIDVSWRASTDTDSTPVAGYDVYSCQGKNCTNYTLLANVTAPVVTSFKNSGLTTSASYSYKVAAYDTVSPIGTHISAQSSAVSATTLVGNSTKFTVSQKVQVITKTNVRSTASTMGSRLGTQAVGAIGTIANVTGQGTNAAGYFWWNVTFASGVSGWVAESNLQAYTAPVTYTLTLNKAGAGAGTVTATCGTTACPASVNAGTQASLSATPSNGSTFKGWTGMITSTQNPLAITVSANTMEIATFNTNTVADTTAPSAPTGLTANAISSSQINLTWSASTDPAVTGQTTSGVAGYHIYRGDKNGGLTPFATITTTSYSDTGLTANTNYSYAVTAFDVAGNESGKMMISMTTKTATVSGQTVSATDCSNSAVNTAIGKASSGYTVIVPATSCTWTSVTIPAGVTLRGGDGAALGTATTTITAPGAHIITLSSGSRLAGFSIIGINNSGSTNGAVLANEGLFRIDHNNFQANTAATGISAWGMGGLIDHNTFQNLDTGIGLFGSMDNWGASNPWYQPQTFGDSKAIYIEDNIFTMSGTYPGNGAIDGNAATRYVFRHNALSGTYIGHHGLDSGGWRSTMSWEIYDNTFSIGYSWYTVFNSRGGTGLMFNNTITGPFNGFALLQNFRSDPSYSTSWGLCNGSNSYDGNTDSTGYPCLDQNGRSTGSSATLTKDTQKLSPLYSWNNKMNGTNVGFSPDAASEKVIKQNRDYYNDTQKPGYTSFTYPYPLTSSGMPNPSAGTGGTVTPPPDTTAPSAPTGLTATAISSSQINLTWSASTDNTGGAGVAGYKIYKNGGTTASVTVIATSYNDTGLIAGSNYSYAVSAIDAAGNESGTFAISATTLPLPSTKFTVNQQVQVITTTNVRSTPSTSGTSFGTRAVGVIGTISNATGQGVSSGGYFWWLVGFNSTSCTTAASVNCGWVAESNLQAYTAPVTYSLTVNKAGTGAGTVSATCGTAACPASVNAGTGVSLSATPASGSAFTGWTGTVISANNPLSVIVNGNTTETATFNSSNTSASTYYVATNGSDSNPGTLASPWLSISNSLGKMKGGDTLYIRGGTYTGSVDISKPSGTSTSTPTVVKAYNGEAVILKGNSISSGSSSLIGVNHFIIDGITFTGSNIGYIVESVNDVTIKNSTVHDVGQQGWFIHNNSSYVTLDHSTVYNTGLLTNMNGEGIYIGTAASSAPYDNTNNVSITNNTVYNIADEGIELKNASYKILVDGNTFTNINNANNSYGLGGGAIEINESSGYSGNPQDIIRNNVISNTPIGIRVDTGATVYNNIVYGVSGTGIQVDNSNSYARNVYFNTIDATTAKALSGGSSQTVKNNIGPSLSGNVASNSAFYVNAANHDYHLVSGSSAINAGAAISGITTDKDGVTRASPPDMGAYEYTGTVINPTTNIITASSGSNGTISPSGQVSVNSGANQAFIITPITGYQVLSVTVDGAAVTSVATTGGTYTFTGVTATHTISVAFSTVVAQSGISCDQATVQNAINAAATGATIICNAGSWTWGSQVTLSKNITLKGAGNGGAVTTITSNIGRTIIMGAGNRITGFTFKIGSPSNSTSDFVSASVGSVAFRIDNNVFDARSSNGFAINTWGDGPALIDHNTFYDENAAINPFGNGDASWSSPSTIGTGNQVYIEDNSFVYTNPALDGALDSYNGAKWVFRHNTVSGVQIGSHGLDSGGFRSTFSEEVYNNTFDLPGTATWDTVMNFRGGSGVVFNNTFTGHWNTTIKLQNYRSSDNYTSSVGNSIGSICNGSASIDGNTAGGQGWPCKDQIGRSTNQTSNPFYAWSNTINGQPANAFASDVYNSTRASAYHILSGRDFFNGTPKPGYTPFTYPYPLAANGMPNPSAGTGGDVGGTTVSNPPPSSGTACTGTCYYVTPSGAGSKNGSDWNNAMAWSSMSFTRGTSGTTYYLAGGQSYAGKTLSTANSGTNLVTIKKATSANSGSVTGWQTAYDSQATLSGGFTFASSYWSIDGSTGAGTSVVPADLTPADYGFAFANGITSNGFISAQNINFTDISMSHIAATAPTNDTAKPYFYEYT